MKEDSDQAVETIENISNTRMGSGLKKRGAAKIFFFQTTSTHTFECLIWLLE